ncbi:uncharacterized protein LOC126567298 [Anopheles maculipalpis]|uniref:uncharacterized protein LOC126567298 n=1 Tax=Anopheles maculipalpis TaxID=1496333 RepID=UPI002159225E|nr:uncharacterized protein LOC126567298 [Anopheles maculipalpis]
MIFVIAILAFLCHAEAQNIATNNNELLFIISCPRLSENILNKIQVYGINNIGKQIHVPHPYYLSHKSQMFTVASLDKDFYNTEDLQEDNSSCIPAIMKGQPASSDFVSNPPTQEVHPFGSHLILRVAYKRETLLAHSSSHMKIYPLLFSWKG